MLHQFTAVEGAAKRVSTTPPATMPEVGGLGTQLVVDAGAAVLVLLVITTLGVYRPWGRTRYGRRKQPEERGEAPGPGPGPATGETLALGLKLFLAVLGMLLTAFAVVHLAGGGLGRHGP